MDYTGRIPYSQAPHTVPVMPHEDWRSDAVGPFPSAGHSDVNITIEGPPEELTSQGNFGSETTFHDMAQMHSVDERYANSLASVRKGRSEGIRPGQFHGMPFSPAQNSSPPAPRRPASFNAGHVAASQFRSYSDTAQSRPQFTIQSHQLTGSAVDDESSPAAPSPISSVPSSPVHSGYGSHSPMPPWIAGAFLAPPPTTTYGPHTQSFRGSDTSSNGSSSPNLDWDGSALHFDLNNWYRQQALDNSLHPPMLPSHPWGATDYLTSSGMMYRNPDTSSLFSSDGSSVRSPSPNHEWYNAASPVSDFHLEDTAASVQDDRDESPKTSSSNETERPASRLDEAFTRKLRVQDEPGLDSSSARFASHPYQTPTDVGPSPILTQHSGGSAGYDLSGEGFGSEGAVLPWGGESSEGKARVRAVSTVAGRRAAAGRRKGNGQVLHVCQLCNADFTAKHNLHSESYFFISLPTLSYTLADHMRSHNSIKDFICKMCNRGFGTKHVLQRHAPKCPRRPNGNKKRESKSAA
ncbi:hypothetical protein DFH08DRAFT_437637 [Mycena albidolilacea]|uniref:C2H2-type domain-containing protein n=1 Tax=Mycena albidolilacea TaxID=1033008 RepID=A0AAD7AG40_9AGAR|nr:hypothetical protein DFH08DRAFT_437637 [Mycena albidolilacea]